jgi:small subunit ribosomal protein S6
LRHLTIKTKTAVTEPSAMMKEEKSRSLTGDTAQQAAPVAAAAENAAPAEPASA